MDMNILKQQVQVGDIVFIHTNLVPFRKISEDTKSWTNHVGIVVDVSGKHPLVAESTFPFSRVTRLSSFIRRSKDHRVEIKRLHAPLNHEQQVAIQAAAQKRMGIFYDTGFDLYSRRQFCSRFVYEILAEAIGEEVGTVEKLQSLFADNPDADLAFWRLWYFGIIPWQRETVTPASVLASPKLRTIFDNALSL
jgi:Permuted papain-like amidase enzyme, YaeF/YiiX, C92 family